MGGGASSGESPADKVNRLERNISQYERETNDKVNAAVQKLANQQRENEQLKKDLKRRIEETELMKSEMQQQMEELMGHMEDLMRHMQEQMRKAREDAEELKSQMQQETETLKGQMQEQMQEIETLKNQMQEQMHATLQHSKEERDEVAQRTNTLEKKMGDAVKKSGEDLKQLTQFLVAKKKAGDTLRTVGNGLATFLDTLYLVCYFPWWLVYKFLRGRSNNAVVPSGESEDEEAGAITEPRDDAAGHPRDVDSRGSANTIPIPVWWGGVANSVGVSLLVAVGSSNGQVDALMNNRVLLLALWPIMVLTCSAAGMATLDLAMGGQKVKTTICACFQLEDFNMVSDRCFFLAALVPAVAANLILYYFLRELTYSSECSRDITSNMAGVSYCFTDIANELEIGLEVCCRVSQEARFTFSTFLAFLSGNVSAGVFVARAAMGVEVKSQAKVTVPGQSDANGEDKEQATEASAEPADLGPRSAGQADARGSEAQLLS
ncbi:unnamed protein product [Prorocentrum cordatum]|uniref:G-protein coupled receptors family 1 profile domain-containing protein n=1 Tax=Prorocentrum cordatum TaxID=2364126 RepID=A0ABN9V6Y7_9DINO|nr:unnamed protein product [Polarella glacialis]